jgi:hypothetical protein
MKLSMPLQLNARLFEKVNKYRDVCPELSKSQRSILEALGLSDSR